MERPPLAVFWRTCMLDASWHPERMQGGGYLYALLPALARAEDPAAATRHHTVTFGTNIYVAPAVIGAVAQLELQGERGAATRVRDWLAAPLSGAADLFYWGALRPALMASALVGVVFGSPALAVAAAWLLFNITATWGRWRCFRRGVAASARLLQERERVRPPRSWIVPLHRIVLIAAVALPVLAIVRARFAAASLLDMGLALGVGYYAARRQVSPGIAFLVLVALGVLMQRLELPTGWNR
ncbi:MAG: PTS system mannose/fructose/sorbose family transporter subunit IID [Candidatus Latescibacterota bacterium]|nr:MAG: PTS system mannose/fructose/sorbose family transporter subunit IID [Candidatus Latescibacterota bacterium]